MISDEVVLQDDQDASSIELVNSIDYSSDFEYFHFQLNLLICLIMCIIALLVVNLFAKGMKR